MFGRVAAAALAIALLPLPALPQCNLSPVLSDQFRSSILDLAIDGNDLWAATSYGLSLYDRSVDPPRLVASIPVPGTTRFLRLGNGLAYAGSGNSIAVVRRSGRSLQLIRTVDAGAPVNDLVVTALALLVATRNGIAQYSLTDPANPNSPLQITQTPAISLALAGTTLYAARGDSTVDVYIISPIVQSSGSIVAPASVTAVHANNGKLFVSTAIQTYIFIGSANVGSVPFSLTSLTALSGDAVFAGSTDRTLRGIDFSLPGTPIDIFRGEVPVSSGTINRLTALTAAGGRLYAGAGDAGIADYDITNFSSPFTMRGYPFADTSSVVSTGANFYVGRANGITEFSQTPIPKRSWDGSRSDVVQDGDGAANFLLTSSGAALTFWTLASTIPQNVTTVTFRAPVKNAVLIGTTAYALLNDRTLWSADLTQAQPAPQQIPTPSLAPVSIAHSGNSIALADTRSDGTTAVAYYTDIQSVPMILTVAGLATTPVTLSGSVAAVQTFRGISLIDFNTSIAGVLPQSNADIARQLILNGATLLELTDTSVRVWNVQSQTVTAELRLPGQPVAMHVAPQSNILD